MTALAHIVHVASRRINRLTEGVVAGLAAFFTVLLIISVFSRYVLNVSIISSVELVRISFCWSVFLAAACAVARDGHVKVDFLARALPPAFGRLLRLFADLVTLGFGLAMVWSGTELSQRMFVAVFPILQISVAWMFSALPVSGALIVLHAFDDLLTPSPPEPLEETVGAS